jgi:hypothetical protein
VAFDASHYPVHGGGARVAAPNMVELRRYCFSPIFSLFILEKHATLAKNQKSMLLVNFIIFDPYSFNCIKFDLFFQFCPLEFDFYINFVILFYDISGLTLNVLISNFKF